LRSKNDSTSTKSVTADERDLDDTKALVGGTEDEADGKKQASTPPPPDAQRDGVRAFLEEFQEETSDEPTGDKGKTEAVATTVNPPSPVTAEATPETVPPPKPVWKLQIFAGDEHRTEEIELPLELEPAAATEEPSTGKSRWASSLWKSFMNTTTRSDERPPVLAAP
jgi:hypothetical protein